jgi:hypothetical protein
MDRWGVAVGLLGVGLGLIGLPYTVHSLPQWLGILSFWLGVGSLIASAIIAAWETKWLRAIRARFGIGARSDLVSMDEAVRYIWQKSRWAGAHERDDKWFMTIQRDVRDALRLAHVHAFGRPLLPSGQVPAGFDNPMQPIEAEHWRDHSR